MIEIMCQIAVVFIFVINMAFSLERGQMPCHDSTDCLTPMFDCRDKVCTCERSLCDIPIPKSPGERCVVDSDCMSTELMCYGKGEHRACRCKKMYTYDLKFNRCLKDDAYVYDPVQNFIIPAIIVMSVGAMVYLGVKLFCNCGKMWRRRQSELSRELETITGVPHQQPTWIASYRVFSQISNSGQHTLHPAPCMGLFVPGLTTSPPPYEEALKHKVIMSSLPAPILDPASTSHLQGLPAYPFEPPPPLQDSTAAAGPVARPQERDHNRTLRYYPGDVNPQVPTVWNNDQEIVQDSVLADSQRQTSRGTGRRGRRYPRPPLAPQPP